MTQPVMESSQFLLVPGSVANVRVKKELLEWLILLLFL